eukprot:gene2079-1951_t
MLLEWIDQLGLLKAIDTKNILKDFPLEVKRIVVTEVVKYVSSKYDTAIPLFTTSSHIDFLMEITAQSFQLPISDHEVIDQAIGIYSKWFLTKNRPEVMNDPKNTQLFYKEMFRHFTFLFQMREDETKDEIKEHIRLCNRVLEIFLKLAAHGELMDEETWNFLLLIILGITDHTLRGKRGILELSYPILKVLFELWVSSLIDDKVMWHHFQNYASQWHKHIALIHQWDAVITGLTLKIIHLIYGPTEGNPTLIIKWEGLTNDVAPLQTVATPVSDLEIPDEYTYLVWNLILNIIGNPNDIEDPKIHFRCFKGLQNLIKIFNTIGRQPISPEIKKREGIDWQRFPYPPDCNTILDIFSAWLFEAVNTRDANYNEGRAIAYSSLCQMYCRRSGKPYQEFYLSLFYNAIINGLKEDELIITHAILMNSCKVFSFEELEGSQILIPHYMQVCEKILKIEKGKANPYQPELRSSCITLFTSLISFPNRYAGKDQSNEKYVNLKIQIADLLEKSLACEPNSQNIKHILWSISVFIFEEQFNDQKVCCKLIQAIFEMLPQDKSDSRQTHPIAFKDFTTDVFTTIFEVLSSLVSLYPVLQKGNDLIGEKIVDRIASYIKAACDDIAKDKTLSSLLVDAYYCLTDWVVTAHQEIMTNNKLLFYIIKSIETCLNFTALKHGNIEEARSAANYLLSHLFNFVGNYPPTNNVSTQTSALIFEDQIAFDEEEVQNSNYTKYFVYDDKYIFALVEQPDEKGGPGCTLIVRDITGKFAWDASVLFGQKEIVEKELFGKYTGAKYDGLTGHTKELDKNSLLMKHSKPEKPKEYDDLDKFFSLIETQEENEDGFYEEISESYEGFDISLKPPEYQNRYQSDCKFQISRLFLSQLGFLSFGIGDKKRFYQLQYNLKMMLNIKALDGMAEREAHKFGVIYVPDGCDSQDEILKFESEDVSEDFQSFVESLGWNVHLKEHSGFVGGLDKKLASTGEYAPYWSDYKSEFIFHVPSMMPTSSTDQQQIHKKRHIGNDHCKIIWSEHTRDWFQETITSHFNLFQIVIYPLEKSNLLRVEILKKESNIETGPLQDGMVVSRHIIGSLARMTAVNANKIARNKTTGYQRPHAKRAAQIADIVQRYKTDIPVHNYYSNLFFTKENAIKHIETKNQYKKKK